MVESRHTLLASSGLTVSTAVCLMNSSNSLTSTDRPLCIGLNKLYMLAKSYTNRQTHTCTHTERQTHGHRHYRVIPGYQYINNSIQE